MRIAIRLFAIVLVSAGAVCAQSPNATVNGQVLDTSGGLVADATVEVVNEATNASSSTKTNSSGIYLVPDLPPAIYRIQVSHIGFKTIVKPDVILNVRDAVEINFTLPIGAISETVTVEGGAPIVDTEDAAVSTVVDRQFAENLPMNGRSFQTLIELAPGVVLTPTNNDDGGQFSVNGQRPSGNYWMVDGVSANIGVSSGSVPGNGFAGALGSFSVLGGTNSLVSVDAMQEFRIQTSTYAPEFGRTPGAQISIVTRSGTNQFHGTGFDYVRNDIFDANNWFNGYTNNPPLPKAKERQNDFGGTFSGPLIKDRTFFFFSYEGLRLQLPQTALTTVPDLSARQAALPVMQPYLNAFPLDPKQPDLGNGVAQFNASYSNPASLDAYSLRVDHKLTGTLNLFARYDYSPSQINQRGAGGADTLSTVLSSRITTQTLTVGSTWALSSATADDLRFNYSRTNSTSSYSLDDFGGAVPLASLPFPNPYTAQNAQLQLVILGLQDGSLSAGKNAQQLQQQINIVDNLSMQKGPHSLKLGVDYRRLTPLFSPNLYFQGAYFLDVPSAMSGSLLIGETTAAQAGTLLFRNLGLFAQDTWRVDRRLTITYGVRWDVDFAPSSITGPALNAVTGFNLNNLSQLALAPSGASPYNTPYKNFAPRLGVAYQLSGNQNWQTVLRGGFGVFYDLATEEVGNSLNFASYPFGARNIISGTFPLSPSMAAPPPIAPPNASNSGILYAFDPHLQLPYTLQWNVALEQALGNQQSISASYIGAAGRRLIQTAYVSSPNANYSQAQLVGNTGDSNYNALQLQFQRRLSHGLQTLASYTWSHSIDDGSAGSVGVGSNAFVTSSLSGSNRGPSDFDIRNSFTAGITYDVPAPKINALANALLNGWSTETFLLARSAPPVDVYESMFFSGLGGFTTNVRPDVELGIPLYLYGPNYPGGKVINNIRGAVTCSNGSPSVGPFCPPPTNSSGNPVRQGDFARNALRGFGATQWDFAVHREFPIREAIKLQFRAEMFNVLNHPNFGPPDRALSDPQFGFSTQMLGNSLGGTSVGGGGLSPLYQVGGPRSVQFALKLLF